MGQIQKCSDKISVHVGSPSQNVLNLILKSPGFVPYWANLIQFGTEPDMIVVKLM